MSPKPGSDSRPSQDHCPQGWYGGHVSGWSSTWQDYHKAAMCLLSLLCPQPGSGESHTPEHAAVLWAASPWGVQFTRAVAGAGLRTHVLNNWLILRCPSHDDIASEASETHGSSLLLLIQVCSGGSRAELGLQQAVQGT